jgi:hypothetical protein
MGRLSEIYAGWKNYAFKNPQVEEQARDRAKTCVGCDKLRRNNTCSICGCYIPAKVRSPRSKCPLHKW